MTWKASSWCYLLAVVSMLTSTTSLLAAPSDSNEPTGDFESPLEPFEPRKPRSEAEQDRITSSAHFAHGRMLMQREDYRGALQRFERAWRYDSTAVSILTKIVPLAFELNRDEEAARYAVILAETDPNDIALLRRLAMHLTQQRQWPRALKLYEKANQLEGDIEGDPATVIARMEMGRLYFLTEEFNKSADNFSFVRDVLDEPERFSLTKAQKKLLLGKADLTYALFAESFFLAGRLDDASTMFHKANQAKPNEDLLAFRLARIDAKRSQADQALEKLDHYFEAQLSIAGSEPYQLLSEILAEKEKDDKLAKRQLNDILEKLYEADPANSALAHFLASSLLSLEQLDKAEIIYIDVLQLQPTLDAHQGLIDIYYRQKNHVKLLSALGKAVQDTGSLDDLGEAVNEISQDADLVDKLIELARQREQNDPSTLAKGEPLAVALLALAVEKFDDADEFFELAFSAARPKPRKAQVMMTWGLEMFMADQSDRAARVFQRSIDDKVMPENNQAFYFYLAGALEYAGKTDEAIVAAKRAEELDPNSVRFQGREAWIIYHAKLYDRAEKLYLELLDRFDSDYDKPEIRLSMREARLVLSNISVQQNRLPQAEEWLEQVLDEYPQHIGALNDLGYLWADQNKHLHRALKMVSQAVESDPENIAYRDSLGWAYYRLGRYQEAIEELERATQGDDPDGVILDHLGDVYLKNKQPQKALATWRRAVKEFQQEENDKMLKATQAKIDHASANSRP